MRRVNFVVVYAHAYLHKFKMKALPLPQSRCFLSSFMKLQKIGNPNKVCWRPTKRTMSSIKEKTELDRKLESINYSLNDTGNDDCLSIPYHSEPQMQEVVIENLVMFGVERDLVPF